MSCNVTKRLNPAFLSYLYQAVLFDLSVSKVHTVMLSLSLNVAHDLCRMSVCHTIICITIVQSKMLFNVRQECWG